MDAIVMIVYIYDNSSQGGLAKGSVLQDKLGNSDLEQRLNRVGERVRSDALYFTGGHSIDDIAGTHAVTS